MNFVTLDFETAKYSRESACAIGLVKFRDGEVCDTCYSLIRPPILYIRPEFTDIHGITVDDVRDAPAFDELWESDILPFIGGLPLAAHNASFDMGVLKAVLEWYELPLPRLPYFCTLILSRNVWPALASHSLPNLGKHFGITYDAHNALADARACGDIACLAAQKTRSATLTDLLHTARVGMKELR